MKQLFQYQQNALDAISPHSKAMLALDMGLGKTFTSLKWLETKMFKKEPALILVQSQKVDDWVKEINETLPTAKVIPITTSKQWDPNRIFYSDEIVVMSYQLFVLLNKKLFMKYKYKWNLIIDESQVLKSYNSKISKYALKFKELSSNVLLLTGDPISTGYKDLFIQMKMIDLFPDNYRYTHFLEDFCITRILAGTSVKLICGYKNIDTLLDHLRTKAYFLKTEEAIDLPEQTFIPIYCDKDDEIYDTMKAEQIVTVDNQQIASEQSLTLLSYLRQLCSGFIYDSEHQAHYVDYDRCFRFNELLESTSNNIVVFYNFKAEFEKLKAIADNNNWKFVQINGEKNTFNVNAEYSSKTLFAIQYQSGAKGIDGLQKFSNTVVYFSPPLSGELYKQSLKRIHRVGQSNKCIYYQFIAKDSVEERIYQRLSKFEDYTDEIFKKEFNLK